VVEQGGRLFVELSEVEDGWWWRSGMIGSMLEIGFRNFGMLVLDNAEDRIRECCWLCIAHCMVWLTSLDCSCGEG
jgi:hypothetical protein